MGSPFEHETLSISKLFPANEVYKVPRYQRDFSWKAKEQVADLFSDFADAFENFSDSNYFLGQIIVCPSSEGVPQSGRKTVLDIIDGQQRLTTIFLYLWIGLKLVKENWADLEEDANANWNYKLFSGTLINPSKLNAKIMVPALLPPKPGIPFFEALVNDALPDFERSGYPTETNLIEAQEEIEQLFSQTAAEKGWEYVWNLIYWVAENVYIFRLETSTESEALRHFLNLNDRGMHLAQVDIVKSLIFQNVSEDSSFDDDKIDDVWNETSAILAKARRLRLKSMSALLKFLIGSKTGVFVAATGSSFAEKWAKILETPGELEDLLEELPKKARAVVDLSKGEDGVFPMKYDTDLTIGTRLAGATQQIEVLLEGDNLQRPAFETLLKVMEDRMLLSVWGPEAARTIEPKIHEWAKELATLNKTSTSPEDIVEFARTWYPDGNVKKFAREALDYAFSQWSYETNSHRDRIRYLLARTNRLVDSAFDASSVHKKLKNYMEKQTSKSVGFHIDHVFPQDAQFDSVWEQSEELNIQLGNASRKQTQIHSIGNLALLYKNDNLEASNSLPSSETKRKIYSGQSHFIQKALAGENWRGSDWAEKRYTQLIDFLGVNLSEWNEDAVIRMAENYKKLMWHDIASTLGLESELIEWLVPLKS